MSKNDVNIVVKARDDASRKFGRIGRSAGGMGSAFKKAAVAAAGLLAVRALFNFAKETTSLFGIQEMAVNHLASALDNLGKGGPAVMKSMGDFASQIQKMTTIGDEATLEVMSMAASIGNLAGNDLKKATVAAIGLSKKLKMDLSASMKLVARAAAGDTASFTRYGIKLDATMSAQEKFNEVLKIGADSFKLATAEIQTSTGQLAQWGNVIGDIKEKIGGSVMSMVKQIASGFKTTKAILGTFEGDWGFAADAVGFFVQSIRGLIKNLATVLIFSFTAAETVVTNWGKTWSLVGKSIHLTILQIVGNIKHFFVGVIPDLLRWFKDNWKEVFVSIWRGTKSIIANMGKNLVEFFKSTKDLFTGKGWTFEWTGLLDGFESAVKEMPKIIARQIADQEKDLKKQIASMAGDLGAEFSKNLLVRLDLLESGAPKKEKAVGLAALGLSGGATASVGSASATAAGSTAAGKGLAAAESRFLTMKAGTRLTPADKNTGKMVDQLKGIADSINKQLQIVLDANSPGGIPPATIRISEA